MNRFIKMMLISLSVLGLAGAISAVVIFKFIGDETNVEGRSIDDMNAYSYAAPEVTTDLKDGSFVRIQFKIITDGKDGHKEIEKREFQIKNILIKELAIMTEEDFNTGLSDLEGTVKEKLNEVMTDGTITDVYTISKILQ